MANEKAQSHRKKESELQEMHNYSTYLVWKNGHINNERKYLAWIRTSIGLFTLGFIVERIELFLRDLGAGEDQFHFNNLPLSHKIIPIVFFALGGIIIIIATWEFFLDRHRLNEMEQESTLRLDVLVVSTLILLVIVAVLFLLPGFQIK